MKSKLILFLIFISVCSLLLSTTWHIKLDGTGNFTTIQEGIDNSTDADTVLVYPGTYFENLDFNGKNIMLCSQELTTGNAQFIASTIIDGQKLESCIRIHNGETNAHIRGFTIQNGFGTEFWSRDGGGVLVHDYSTIYITNCIIKNNIATLGAGIYARNGFLNVSNTNLLENSAGWGGAIYMADESTINFDDENLCNIYNNNAGKGSDIFAMDTGHINVIVDTFSVFNPSNYFAEYLDGSTFTFNIQHNWMELIPHDLYVAVDGDDLNSGLSANEPLRNISWAVRKIQADEQNPRTIHVSSGTYSWETNQQIFPVGCKEYVSVIGENKDTTILLNDYTTIAIVGHNLNGFTGLSNFSIMNSSDNYTNSIITCFDVYIFKLSNIIIQNNSNLRFIILNEWVSCLYDNLIISDNITDGSVSGLYFANNSGYVKNSIIKNNINIDPNPNASVAAMDLMAYDDITFENCVFSNNQTTSQAGRVVRITNHNGGDPIIKFNNCLFSDNLSGSSSVFQNYNHDGITELNNCTFSNNTSGWFTILSEGDIDMKNTIMHDNTDYEIFMADDTINNNIYELNVDYCNIKNGEDGIVNQGGVNIINWGEGNIESNPLFLETGDHPYQLSNLSPCIDAGTPDTTGLFLPPWDLLHHQRIWDGDGNGTEIIDMGCYEFGADSVGVHNHEIPLADYELRNYPNPFNPETKISFNIPDSGKVKVEIYNIKGQQVKSLMNCASTAGKYELIWKGRDDTGKQVSSGEYIILLRINSKNKSARKIMLLK